LSKTGFETKKTMKIYGLVAIMRIDIQAPLTVRDLSLTRGFPIAWIFDIPVSCRNLSEAKLNFLSPALI